MSIFPETEVFLPMVYNLSIVVGMPLRRRDGNPEGREDWLGWP